MRNPALLLLLLIVVFITVPKTITARTFLTLHSFTATPPPYQENTDGAFPFGGVTISNGVVYGTASGGGVYSEGTVFALNTNGSNFTVLHNFNSAYGAGPDSTVIVSGNMLYGTASSEGGGITGTGTVFALNTNGDNFTVLHIFSATTGTNHSNSGGSTPFADVVLSGDTLSGTTYWGGIYGSGTIFSVKTNDSSFTVLHNFGAETGPNYTNSDGAYPESTLILLGNTLYGTAGSGGITGSGTVFALNTNGSNFTVLYAFSATSGTNSTNIDGQAPSSLLLSGNTLYGTAGGGGINGSGTVFALNTNGSNFTVLHAFSATSGTNSTNIDGEIPSSLLLSGNTLYGTACVGGINGSGTVFALNTNGSNFTVLYAFSATSGTNFTNSDGSYPRGSIALSGNTLYGAAPYGGAAGNGTVFSLTLPVPPPMLNIIAAGPNVILTWATNATGFNLESTTNLLSGNWSTNVPPSVVVNGQNTVTNAVTNGQMYFRLSY